MSIKDLNNRMDRLMQRGLDPRRPPFLGCRVLTGAEYEAEQERERQRPPDPGASPYRRQAPAFVGLTIITSKRRTGEVLHVDFTKGAHCDERYHD